ncbi:TRAP transporter small permease [Thiothrix eikelboomii]|uniref:TRAP transporter small permease protein n=1 Tax=Thiothrix eikelboomii TaxID=92487 RepID=A0A1T4VZE4_9GAMM|nr:TRAP transporter small permease [Thiothrix eikelboomii]SKA70356.1 Tripartite ATP-independent transporter, DctQ component [Thiothrix eikelboomii]
MRSFLYRLADYFALGGGLIIMAIVLVTTTNVTAFALNRIASLLGGQVAGLSGYEDFVRLAMSAAALMFFPYAQVKHGHVAVDIFMNKAPAWLQRFTDKCWAVLIVIMALFLMYWMIIGLFEKRADHVVVGVLNWVEWPFYIPGILSLLLWAAIALVQVFDQAPVEVSHV